MYTKKDILLTTKDLAYVNVIIESTLTLEILYPVKFEFLVAFTQENMTKWGVLHYMYKYPEEEGDGKNTISSSHTTRQ
jgi:hypothetical protein